ncbi:MAG: calcium/sodium antiporter [Candidatus Paceibacterota bacterium]
MTMSVFFTLTLFALGFYILIKGANLLISGATSLAHLFGLSPWFIGVVIVGIGTSIPEFSINVASVFEGNNIGLATIIGSNTFNILFILGISALFAPLVFKRSWIVYDLPINMFAVLVVAALITMSGAGSGEAGLSRADGFFLVTLLVLWILFMLRRKQVMEYSLDTKGFSWVVSVALMSAGLVGVFLGGKWIVDGAEVIAIMLGVSPALIGFTVVAIGTSVPELAVSIVAVTKRQTTIAIGNIIGSNVFDFLGILGITALMKPIVVRESLQFDIFAAFGATLILMLSALLFGRRFTISRTEGAIFVALYLAYFAFLFIRG